MTLAVLPQEVILIIADISGYTRFMTANVDSSTGRAAWLVASVFLTPVFFTFGSLTLLARTIFRHVAR